MHIIHATPTFVLEADFTHDAQRDIHTLDLYQTWPTMAHPHRRRIAQLNLPRTALAHLAAVIADAAAANPETARSGS
jgi:hypothetical protein